MARTKLRKQQGEKVKEEKQIVVKEVAKPLAVAQQEVRDIWGDQELSTKDILIGKIWPMQLTSKKVIDEEALFGEFRDSINNEIKGTLKQPFEVIPFMIERKWIISRMVGNKKEFAHAVPIVSNPALPTYNDEWAYEFVDENGDKMIRDRTIDLYVLLPGEPQANPYIMTFKRTSLRAAKKITTQMFTVNKNAGKEPPASLMVISGTKTTNDLGSFVVMDASKGREATPEELARARQWFKTLKGAPNRVEIVEGEDASESFSTSEEPSF